MKLGVLSDIHCNTEALRTAFAILRRASVDEIVFLGDAINEFRFSNQTVQMLRDHDARMVLGNHERVFLDTLAGRASDVEPSLLRWLIEQPEQITTTLNGRSLLAFHGSPWRPADEYLFPGNPKLRLLGGLEFDIVLFGHTHWKLADRFGSALVVNPGSAGQPSDYRNGLQCSVAILDVSSLDTEFIDFPNPGAIRPA